MTSSTTRSDHRNTPVRRLALTAAFAFIGASLPGCSTAPETFKTPDEAAQSLISALKPVNKERLIKILGSDGEDIISSGDDVADQGAVEKFLDLYNQKHELVAAEDGVKVLQVGPEDWPLPIPIVEENGKWSFDSEAGKEEILNRRIGRNELSAIQVCLAIVDAERDYAMLDPDNNGVHEYAQHFFSDPGKHNGLYWEAKPGEPESPLGPFAAEASEEGYRRSSDGSPHPYHGYYYRILKGQGDAAPGGAREFVIGGRMFGGFGVVAWPADYQNSGIMTFITSHDGVVYQKDLGPGTDSAAKKMTLFDPAAGWTKAEAVP